MKREFVEEQQEHSRSMFAKLQQHQKHNFQLAAPQQQQLRPESGTPTHGGTSKDDAFTPPGVQTGDGSTIEVVRRPRGRPPGSKNKPKPPVVITRDSTEQSMSPYVFELPGGVDIAAATAAFCRKRNMGMTVLSGHGFVSNVTLKQPGGAGHGGIVTFHGRFDVLSISATIIPSGDAAGNGQFTIFLAGPQGQVVGGAVVGPLVSAGTIYLIAATFNNPTFDKLQEADDEDAGGGDVGLGQSQGHESRPLAITGGESGGAPIYSYQASDVIWAPAARPAQQPF